jgi:radical SAM protein with 4Fe4S-binding SPASM domain
LALLPEELPVFDELLSDLERECAADFRSGFIAESPAKLRRMLQYFGALCGQAAYPEVRCNAPEFSAVIGAAGRVQPCFFISGPAESSVPGADADLSGALNGERMRALRSSIREGERAECRTCVCYMWRDPQRFGSEALPWL